MDVCHPAAVDRSASANGLPVRIASRIGLTGRLWLTGRIGLADSI
ncbi:MAG: hypothetical protein ACR2H0_06755 [Candidatus Limnocylindrales bacterium]